MRRPPLAPAVTASPMSQPPGSMMFRGLARIWNGALTRRAKTRSKAPISAWDCVGATADGVNTPPLPIRALGTPEDPRPVSTIGTALDDDGAPAGARPTNAI